MFATKAISRITRIMKTTATSLATDPIVILNYHRVNEPTSSANSITVSVEHFREHMKIVRELYDPIPLSLLEEGQDFFRRKPVMGRKPVVITFDDGYADTWLNAVPILEEFNIPATVFVTTGYIDKGQEFWWDESEELLIGLIPDSKLDELQGRLEDEFGVFVDVTLGRESLYSQLTAVLKTMAAADIKEAVQLFRELAEVAPISRDPHRAMTMDELHAMAKHPLIDIGSHGVTHVSLGQVKSDIQRWELSESKRFLEKEIGKKVTSVAYPFGSSADFNSDTFDVARRLGYRVGLTTCSSLVSPTCSPYSLPRFYIKDWSGQEFERRLRNFYWTG